MYYFYEYLCNNFISFSAVPCLDLEEPNAALRVTRIIILWTQMTGQDSPPGNGCQVPPPLRVGAARMQHSSSSRTLVAGDPEERVANARQRGGLDSGVIGMTGLLVKHLKVVEWGQDLIERLRGLPPEGAVLCDHHLLWDH